MTIDIDAIRQHAEFSADPHHAQDVADLFAEIKQLREQLDKPCGSCHPCTNYADETWRAAGRKPPHVIDWEDAQEEIKQLRAENDELRRQLERVGATR